MWTRPTGPTAYLTTTSEDPPPAFRALLWLPAWSSGSWAALIPRRLQIPGLPFWPHILCVDSGDQFSLDLAVQWPQTLVASLGYWQVPGGLWLAEASGGCGLAFNNVCWNDFISHAGWVRKALLEISFLVLWFFPRNTVYKVATLLGQRQNPIAKGRFREAAESDSHL